MISSKAPVCACPCAHTCLPVYIHGCVCARAACVLTHSLGSPGYKERRLAQAASRGHCELANSRLLSPGLFEDPTRSFGGGSALVLGLSRPEERVRGKCAARLT